MTCYQKRKVNIILQNGDGPCPLLAAANCLLLRDQIELPPRSKDQGFVTLEHLLNLLVDFGGGRCESEHVCSELRMSELVATLPLFQYGMGR